MRNRKELLDILHSTLKIMEKEEIITNDDHDTIIRTIGDAAYKK